MAYDRLLRDKKVWGQSVTGKYHYVYILPWTLAAKERIVTGLNKPSYINFIFLLAIGWLALPHKLLI